jgi:UDP-glucose 4-epimerase
MNILHETKKQRAVVIGGAGFIGSYIVRELLSLNYNVVIIDDLSTGSKERIPNNVPLLIQNICDYDTLLTCINEGDIIFHLAALVSVPLSLEKPREAHEINIRGTYNVLEVARVKKAYGVIFSSSAAVYGNQEGIVSESIATLPQTPYGLHKLMGEQLAILYTNCFSLPTVTLRYFNVYGKGHHETGSYAPVIAKFLQQKRNNLPITITGDGLQTRDFVHVEDVARANVMAIELLSTPKNYCLNVCTGESYTIKKIAELVGGTIDFIPARNEIKQSRGDNTRIQETLHWEATVTLENGIEKLLH